MSDKRKKILETFGKVPFLVEDAESSFEDFPSNEPLTSAVMELYVIILTTVHKMMEWLVEPSSCRHHALARRNNMTSSLMLIF